MCTRTSSKGVLEGEGGEGESGFHTENFGEGDIARKSTEIFCVGHSHLRYSHCLQNVLDRHLNQVLNKKRLIFIFSGGGGGGGWGGTPLYETLGVDR